ncbi:MAG: hypothetical protein ACM3YM_12155 [Sphingomonadales bacterium]
MIALALRLKGRAFRHLSENDGWFALAVLTVVLLPVVAVLVY